MLMCLFSMGDTQRMNYYAPDKGKLYQLSYSTNFMPIRKWIMNKYFRKLLRCRRCGFLLQRPSSMERPFSYHSIEMLTRYGIEMMQLSSQEGILSYVLIKTWDSRFDMFDLLSYINNFPFRTRQLSILWRRTWKFQRMPTEMDVRSQLGHHRLHS